MHVCIRVCMCVLLPSLTPAFILCLPLYQGAYIYELQHLDSIVLFLVGFSHGRRRQEERVLGYLSSSLLSPQPCWGPDNDWFLLSTYGQLTFMAPAFMDSSLSWLQLTLFLPCPSDLQVVVIVSQLLLVSRCFLVNSPRIKLSLVQPFWVCLLFPTGNPGWHSVCPSLSHTKSWLSCLALKRQLHLL